MLLYAVINDLQIPFHDKPVVDLVTDFIVGLKPDGVIFAGDVLDCYTLSVFDRNPAHKTELEHEIRVAGSLMSRFRDVPWKVWEDGNHEDRVRRYLWKRAPDFGGLASLNPPALFKLDEHGFQYKPYGDGVFLGKLWVTHGTMVRVHSGHTAKAHFDKYGTSVLHGHTHRLGTYYRTNKRGPHAAYENGCLCSLKPEYVKDPDWQQGFAVVHVDERSGFFNVQQIPIINRRLFFYGGEKVELRRKAA